MPVGSLDVTMYRDDLRRSPGPRAAPDRDPAGRHRRQDRRPRRRRALLRAHRPRRARRPERHRPPARGAARRPRRPRPPRAARSAPTTSARTSRRPPPRRSRCSLAEHDGDDEVRHRGTGHAAAEESSEAAPALRRRPRPRRRPRWSSTPPPSSHRLTDRDGQEAADAARPHGRQPLLRGLHPHPDLVRGRRQAALGRRHQLLAPRARASPRARACKDTALTLEAMGADAVVIRHGAAGAPHRLANSGWIGGRSSTPATAPTSTPRRRCSTRSRCAATSPTASATSTGRRVTIVGDVLHSRVARSNVLAARHARRRGHARRAADPAAGRRRDLAVRTVGYDLDAALPAGRRRDDAARPARADERRVLPERARVLAAATASTRAAWRCCPTTHRHAPRTDEPRHGDRRRGRRLARAR